MVCDILAGIFRLNASGTLWFGRDAFGRRSLVVHWPTPEDSRFALSSVLPPHSTAMSPDPEVEDRACTLHSWEELPCGVYSVSIDGSNTDACLNGRAIKHEWTNSMLKYLIKWDRMLVEPKQGQSNPLNPLFSSLVAELVPASVNGISQPSSITPAHVVLAALKKSIARRTTNHTIFKAPEIS